MHRILRAISFVVIGLSMIIIFGQLFAVNAYLTEEMPIKLIVSEQNVIGFDVNGTALMFGKIPPGSTSTRKIIITNTKNKEVIVILKAHGNVKNYVSFEQNKILLKPFEQREISVFATVPLNNEREEYTGQLRVYSVEK